MMVHRKASLSILGAALTVVACSPAHVASDPAANTISIDLRPGSVEIRPGDVVKFDAIVTGTANASVAWSVQEAGGGAIDATGRYVAPPTPGTYHVLARAVADLTVSSLSTILVTPAPTVMISITPHTTSVTSSGSVSFSAIVTGTANTAATWKVQEGSAGGAVTAAGVYTAPSAAGTYHVVATSVADPSKNDTATVNVTALVVTVSVTPSAATIQPGGSIAFSATVTGTSNTAVSWQVQEGASGGAVTQAGQYTAPAVSGVFHVVATSAANSAINGQAVVTVDSGVRISASSPVSAFACEAVALTATVTGSTDTGVVWSAPASCGTITSAGVFTSVRGSGNCLITAQAHADAAKTASITVNVAPERVLSVAIVPASVSLGVSATQAFAANVTTACGTFPAGS
ncbi:MAG: hypothetical protein E6J58_10750 [Deltaproteobacteria bacterium]|nr:MAG: hypothetical protein E6J58_10750 [Deltaproteobacteria bacterium]